MKKLSRIIVSVFAAAMIFATTGCSSQNQQASAPNEAKNDGKLVMATNAEFPPYEYIEGGEVVGIDVEIAQAIAKEMGKELSIENMNFDSIIPAVQSGKADMGIAGMTASEDRKVNVDFSDSYISASQVIIVKNDNETILTPDDLEGKSIGVQLGTTGDMFASDIKDATIERYNKGFEAVQAVQQGKIDAVIIDDKPAAVFAQQNSDVKVLEEPFTDEDYAIAVKKGNTELVEKINKAISSLKESGELQKIFDKYVNAQ